MAEDSSSTSSEELDGTSARFNPLKALYSKKENPTLAKAPMYDNLKLFLSAQQRGDSVLPVGHSEAVEKRKEEKRKVQEEKEKQLEEKNKQRFSRFQGLTTAPRPQRAQKDLLKRCEKMSGPLSALRDCMENRVRVKVITRHATGVRGQLIGLLEAFDKQWNLAMSDVLEIWRRKVKMKRKVPPCVGVPCAPGTAALRAPVPIVTETPVGKNEVECTRHVPQLMVRGEHIVLVQIVERLKRES